MPKLTAEEVEGKIRELEACVKDRERDCTDLKAEVDRLKGQLKNGSGHVTMDQVEKCVGEHCKKLEDETFPKALDKWHSDYAEQQKQMMAEIEPEFEDDEEDEEDYCEICSDPIKLKWVKYGEEGCTHGG